MIYYKSNKEAVNSLCRGEAKVMDYDELDWLQRGLEVYIDKSESKEEYEKVQTMAEVLNLVKVGIGYTADSIVLVGTECNIEGISTFQRFEIGQLAKDSFEMITKLKKRAK